MSNKIAGLAARKAALRMIDAVLRRGEPLDQAASGAAKGLQPNDRAFAIAIVQETFRWMRDIDALIDAQTRQRLPDDAKVRMVLRMALAQLLSLKTPPHAVVSTGLALLTGGPKRLFHGVFGSISRSEATLPDQPSLPLDVEHRWQGQWGDDMVTHAAARLASPPPLDIALADHAKTEEWAKKLGGNSLAAGHVRIDRGGAIEELPGFDEGLWWVQDLAATLPARILGDGTGRRVLDLCAAPGGKTMQLAAAGFEVTALDKSARRLERLEANLERTQLSANLVKADALDWDAKEAFDAILLDAPCSATGTFRRHPDVLHRAGARQVSELSGLQAELLHRVVSWLTPGASLIYATCSLEQEEGEAQIAKFLSQNEGFSRGKIDPDILAGDAAINGDGDLRTLPHMAPENGGLDGFFVSHLVRN